MKKFILSAILLGAVLMAGSTQAANFRGTSEGLYPPGTAVVKVLESYSTSGVGVPINSDFLADQGSWQIVVDGAAPVFEIAIEGSLVGQTGPFEPISVMDQDSVKLRHWDGKAVPYSQVILNNISGGGAFDLYLIKRGN